MKTILDLKGKKQGFSSSPAFVIFMTILIDMIGFGMVIPLIPFYVKSFQVGATGIGILISSFSLMQFFFSPILGKASDKIGRKPVLLTSIFVSSISYGLFTIASSFFILLLSRVIAGMATEITVARAYIADITVEKERTMGMGRIGAAFGAGIIIGPAIGGSLSVYGFWAPGIAAVALTLLNLLLVFFLLPESIKPSQTVFRINFNSINSFFSKLIRAFFAPWIGIVLIIYFLEEINHSTIPVISPLLGISFFGLQPMEMSYIFMYIGFVQIILQGFIIGRISKRISDGNLIALGIFFLILGMFVIPLIPNFGIFMILTTIIAFGTGILSTIIPSFISKMTSTSNQGGMLGVTQSISSIARVIGPLLGGFIFEFVGLVFAFLLNAILMIVAFVLSIKMIQRIKTNK